MASVPTLQANAGSSRTVVIYEFAYLNWCAIRVLPTTVPSSLAQRLLLLIMVSVQCLRCCRGVGGGEHVLTSYVCLAVYIHYLIAHNLCSVNIFSDGRMGPKLNLREDHLPKLTQPVRREARSV